MSIDGITPDSRSRPFTTPGARALDRRHNGRPLLSTRAQLVDPVTPDPVDIPRDAQRHHIHQYDQNDRKDCIRRRLVDIRGVVGGELLEEATEDGTRNRSDATDHGAHEELDAERERVLVGTDKADDGGVEGARDARVGGADTEDRGFVEATFTPMAAAAVSLSRIAMSARPKRPRMRFQAMRKRMLAMIATV